MTWLDYARNVIIEYIKGDSRPMNENTASTSGNSQDTSRTRYLRTLRNERRELEREKITLKLNLRSVDRRLAELNAQLDSFDNPDNWGV